MFRNLPANPAQLDAVRADRTLNQLLDAFPRTDFADGHPPAGTGLFTRGPEHLTLRLVPPAPGQGRAAP